MVTIKNLIAEIKKYNPKCDRDRIMRAFKFAEHAHLGQKRKSGEDYIYHPLATAMNLTKFQADDDTIIASLLHDVPEDTQIDLSIIKQQFGEEVAFLVRGITKLSKVQYRNNMAERQIESLKKLLLHSAKDLRVILIKLADRLHNMQTIEYVQNPNKIIRISKETLEIYVPIANLLGIWGLKDELEDLCFKHLYPDEYYKLYSKIYAKQKISNTFINKTIKKITNSLQKNHIEIINIHGRQKNLFSIYQKIQKKKHSLKTIYDLIGIRIICKNIEDCYRVLGCVHRDFTPKPHRIKDYIAIPKINGYQSLHTTVFGIKGIPTEFQIRTQEMHLEAEYGVAAHYFYSYNKDKKNLTESKKQWTSRILELKKQFNDPNAKIIDQLQLDIFQNRIFIFTPKGDVIDLPQKATCIDFAYAIHSDIGNHAYKAEINDYEVSISTPLQTNDTVKIITKQEQRPEAEWLDYAKTGLAKRKIKEAINKESREMQIMMGRKRLEKEIYLMKTTTLESTPSYLIKKLLELAEQKTLDDLLLAIGEGKISPNELLKKVYNPKSNDYAIGIEVTGDNRVGIFKDILEIFKRINIDISMLKGKTIYEKNGDIFKADIYAKISDITDLREIFEAISGIPGIKKIEKITPYKTIFISLGFILLFSLWLAHPFIIKYLTFNISPLHPLIRKLLPYTSLIIIYLFTIANESLFKSTLPERTKHKKIWFFSIFLSILGLITVIIEIIIFNLPIMKVFFIIGVIILYLRLYFIYKTEKKKIEIL